jgi:hypothetical protein
MELYKILNEEVSPAEELNHGFQTPENQKRNETVSKKNSDVNILHLCFDNKLQESLDTEISRKIICEVGSNFQTCQFCLRRVTVLQEAYTKLCFMCDIDNPSTRDVYWNVRQVQNTVHTSELPAFASKRHIQDLYNTLQIRHENCMQQRHFSH